MRINSIHWIVVCTLFFGLIFGIRSTAQNDSFLVTDVDWYIDGDRLALAFGRWDFIERNGRLAPSLVDENIDGILLQNTQTNLIQLVQLISVGSSATTIDFSPNGSQIAFTSSVSRGVIDLNLPQNNQQAIGGRLFYSVSYDSTGTKILITSTTGAGSFRSDNIVEGVSEGIGRNSAPEIVLPFLYSTWIGDSTAASSTVDGHIYVWSGTIVLRTFFEHNAPVRRFVWNAATNLIASGDDTGRVLVWNPDTADVVQELTGHTGPILDIDWRPDGGQIATASQDGTLRVWDWPSGSMNIVDTANVFSAVAYSPDGSQLAYAGEVIDPANIQIDIVPVSELVPTPTPTPSPTPAPFQRVRLTALCSANPAAYRVWRVRSMNAYDVVVDWAVYNSPTGQAGFVVVPPAQGSTPGEITFITQTEPGPNTVRIFVNGVLQDTKASNPAQC